jgi:hypothetical protein
MLLADMLDASDCGAVENYCAPPAHRDAWRIHRIADRGLSWQAWLDAMFGPRRSEARKAASADFGAYIDTLIHRRHDVPGDDFVSLLPVRSDITYFATIRSIRRSSTTRQIPSRKASGGRSLKKARRPTSCRVARVGRSRALHASKRLARCEKLRLTELCVDEGRRRGQLAARLGSSVATRRPMRSVVLA